MQENDLLRLVALIMVLFLIAPGFLYYTRRSGKSAAFRNLAIWIIIGLIAAIGFSLFGGA
ncbi:hypothetical protein [Sneathiella limimaris]|uniref:hypothetical protein n=1 Tax=Sneathiella limimaris TaxID=1964213 RepID=UPI00146BFA99|nr:hypothetical protein [Sneathiella limimaris]